MEHVLDDEAARALRDEVFDGVGDEVGVVLGIEEGAQDEVVRAEVGALVFVLEAGHELVVEDAHLRDAARETAAARDEAQAFGVGVEQIGYGIEHATTR